MLSKKRKGRKVEKGTGPFFLKSSPLFTLSKKVTLLVMILKAKVSLRAKHGNLMPVSLRAKHGSPILMLLRGAERCGNLTSLSLRAKRGNLMPVSLRAKRGNLLGENAFLFMKLLHSVRNNIIKTLLNY